MAYEDFEQPLEFQTMNVDDSIGTNSQDKVYMRPSFTKE